MAYDVMLRLLEERPSQHGQRSRRDVVNFCPSFGSIDHHLTACFLLSRRWIYTGSGPHPDREFFLNLGLPERSLYIHEPFPPVLSVYTCPLMSPTIERWSPSGTDLTTYSSIRRRLACSGRGIRSAGRRRI